ncbi:MAG: DUF362 domain-containing protein, partial [Candidatus Bathyarchaeota archaeon]
ILKNDSGLSVRIVESDSESKFADEAFQKFGYTKIEKKYAQLGFDISLVNLSHSPTNSVELDGLHLRDLKLPEIVVGLKYFVSVAIAKTHGLTFITATLKNLFGLLPRKDQSFYHRYINEVIVDLNRFVKPNFCLVDARVGLEGWAGPKTRRLDVIVMGRKPVSVDATIARIMGFNPEKIRHLVEAEKYGLGSLNPEVLGLSIDSAMVKFSSPPHLSPRATL